MSEKPYIKNIEAIKGALTGGALVQSLIMDSFQREGRNKEARSVSVDSFFPVLKKFGVDVEKPEEFTSFLVYLQQHNQGLYLLFKTVSLGILAINPKDYTDTFEENDGWGLSKNDHDVLIRGINAVLFQLESIYRTEKGETNLAEGLPLLWGMCKKTLENTFETVVQINNFESKESPGLVAWLDGFKEKEELWSFFLFRILAIFSENETLDENVQYFQKLWNGEVKMTNFTCGI